MGGAGNGTGQALTGCSAGAVFGSEVNSQVRRPCWVMGKATRDENGHLEV